MLNHVVGADSHSWGVCRIGSNLFLAPGHRASELGVLEVELSDSFFVGVNQSMRR